MSLLEYLPPLQDPSTGDILADGGFADNLPVVPLRRLAWPSLLPPLFTIAVDVESKSAPELQGLPWYGDSVNGFWLAGKRVQAAVITPWLRYMLPANNDSDSGSKSKELVVAAKNVPPATSGSNSTLPATSTAGFGASSEAARSLKPRCNQGSGGLSSFFTALFDLSTVADPDAEPQPGAIVSSQAGVLASEGGDVSEAESKYMLAMSAQSTGNSNKADGNTGLVGAVSRFVFKYPRFGDLIGALKFLPHTMLIRDTLAVECSQSRAAEAARVAGSADAAAVLRITATTTVNANNINSNNSAMSGGDAVSVNSNSLKKLKRGTGAAVSSSLTLAVAAPGALSPTAAAAAATRNDTNAAALVDLYIRPQHIENFKILDYDKWHEIVSIGFARAEPLCALFLHRFGAYFKAY